MNNWIGLGRLTRDPSISTSQSGMQIARFTVAVERRGKHEEGQQNADFIPCTAFGKTAEFADKYLRQGTKMLVRGHIQTGSYQNKDGQKVYTTDIIVDEMEFAESKSASSGQATTPTQPQAPAAGQPTNGFVNVPDDIEDELPFA